MVSNVFLALGSNVGDRENLISKAAQIISEDADCKLIRTSSLYETIPYGVIDQENFYNAAVEIGTKLNIEELYFFVKSIENKVGRTKDGLRWGPREIDVDIIFYNNLIYNSDKITVPHKECLVRDFVLVPLIEIAPEFVHPVLKQKLSDVNLSGIHNNIIKKINFPTNNKIHWPS